MARKNGVKNRVNRTTGVTGKTTRVNDGRATVGKQSGFGTHKQKRGDLVSAFKDPKLSNGGKFHGD